MDMTTFLAIAILVNLASTAIIIAKDIRRRREAVKQYELACKLFEKVSARERG